MADSAADCAARRTRLAYRDLVRSRQCRCPALWGDDAQPVAIPSRSSSSEYCPRLTHPRYGGGRRRTRIGDPRPRALEAPKAGRRSTIAHRRFSRIWPVAYRRDVRSNTVHVVAAPINYSIEETIARMRAEPILPCWPCKRRSPTFLPRTFRIRGRESRWKAQSF